MAPQIYPRHTTGLPVHAGWKKLKPKRPKVFVHHTVTPQYADPVQAAHALEKIAVGRGHNGISYNYLIWVPGGIIIEGRGGYESAGTKGWNSQGYSVAFVGNFETEVLTAAAVEAFQYLMAVLKVVGAVDLSMEVVPHKLAPGAATACPGRNTMALMKRLMQPWRPPMEVQPLFSPPLKMEVVGWCSFTDADRRLATALVAPDGAVYCFPLTSYCGGANGKAYFAGRRAAQIRPARGDERKRGKRYVIVATSGETYMYPE